MGVTEGARVIAGAFCTKVDVGTGTRKVSTVGTGRSVESILLGILLKLSDSLGRAYKLLVKKHKIKDSIKKLQAFFYKFYHSHRSTICKLLHVFLVNLAVQQVIIFLEFVRSSANSNSLCEHES